MAQLTGQPTNGPTGLTIKERKLLARVVSYYQHTLAEDRRGLNYLKNDRGITDPDSLKAFGAGYANGTLLEILPEDPVFVQGQNQAGLPGVRRG